MILGEEIINLTTDKIKDIIANTQKVECKGVTLYEKGTPFYNSKILNISVKWILGGIALISVIRKK